MSRHIYFGVIMISFLALTSAHAEQRKYVGIADDNGDRLNITASGSLAVGQVSTVLELASGTVTVKDGGDSLTVDATQLDIRNLTASSDSVTIAGAVTATATDLDIRELSSTTDSVEATGTLFVKTRPGEPVSIEFHGEYPDSFEVKNYSVPATSNSGASLDPTWAADTFWFSNESSTWVRVCIECAASAGVGQYVGPLGTMSGSYMGVAAISVYNPSASSAAISITYGR